MHIRADLSSPLLSSHRQTFSSTMSSLFQSFYEQTIYLGMPDDSVCNSVGLFLVAKANLSVFSFFLFLWYAGVEKMIRQSLK